MTKKIHILSLLMSLFISAHTQQTATFIEPLCWGATDRDSTVHRITFVSASAAGILEVGYINNNGINITVTSPDSLSIGACECCYGKFPPVNPNLEPAINILSVSQPTFNPINPTACSSTLVFQTTGVTDIADITVEADNVSIPFSWDPITGQGVATATYTFGSGFHTFDVTITTIDCNPCTDTGQFDCG